MSVHFKFKSNLDHDTVTFDGLNISVADLKKAIMHQKKIGKSSDFDLQITNAQTKEVYDNDEMLVPKNTSVIVARVPVQGGSKKNWNEKPDLPLPNNDDDLGRIRYDRIAKSADLVNANTSEEDKVKAMITQSSQEYDPSKYVKSRSMTGPLPPTYTCFRCGKQGHWIKNCPTNNPDIKRSTGIPRSFMVPVDGPEHKGALLTSSGDYAVPLIDHQAYKEVKKEKPPFVPQEEPVAEPEAEIPEELLCMVCKDLLQDAVLIPCCGNSFCDECVRSVLLESDNHECPICHETDVSPNTLIPNRFLRTAVLNYKNETGYTRAKKAMFVKSPPCPERVESPQPSPDSTFESQSHSDANQPEARTKDEKKKIPDVSHATASKKREDDSTSAAGAHTPENAASKTTTEDESDVQPGTPLADEPIDHHLPIQTIGQEHYNNERYPAGHKYSRSHRGADREDGRRRYNDETNEPQSISTIGTIANTSQKYFMHRPNPLRQPFSNQRNRNDNRSDNYSNERDDYHRRYEGRHGDRGFRRNQYYDRPRDSRYHQSNQDYSAPDHELPEFEPPPRTEDPPRRERYRSPPRQILVPPPVVPAAPPIYAVPPVVPAIPHPHLLPAPPQVFPSQPPPPGASPINTSQPPPPGVGPPLLPVPTDGGSVYKSRPYDTEDPLKDVAKHKERSIDDRMEEFQRKLDKQDRKYTRDRGSHSRSRSGERHRSRSLSRSRSFSSSKSWTRSVTRSSTRTPRSRSRTPFSSRSRTRSFSLSRSRSWSKKRSYSRSRSRTRTGSRSRSRSRNEPRMRRRGVSRDRARSPRHHRTRSRSFSPKHYRGSSHRSGPYPSKHNYSQPLPQFGGGGSSYQSQYGHPQPILPIPVMRPPTFPPHHLPTMHQPIQPVHTRPIDQYPIDRSHKYPPYGDQYPAYDVYPPKYEDQRYEREQRVGDHRSARYDKRPEYPRHQEEVGHRIPGWVGDRPRDCKPRYRNTRDQRKEIRELPQIPESEMRAIQTKEAAVEETLKRKEEKVVTKHKKHHHHHKSKDAKKQEKSSSGDKVSESTKNLVKVEAITEKEQSVPLEEERKPVKSTEKGKEKKHKHKKHKAADHLVKKKRSSKKQKAEVVPSTDSEIPVKIKIKKKKVKPKALEVVKTEEISPVEGKTDPTIASAQPQPEVKENVADNLPETEVKEKPTVEQDILDIFADEPDGELADVKPDVATEVSSNVGENNASEDVNVEEENAESGNSEEEEEEDAEESAEEENVLKVDMPGISKWEREESEDEYSASVPQRRSSVVSVKEEKGSISSDIISRAENALIAKQFKPRIESKVATDSKDSSEDSTPERSPARHKEVPELKSVVNKEQVKPDTLKVTISHSKDKRSVYSRKEESRKLQSESVPSKRIESDRSARYRDEQNLHRSVAVYPVREDERSRSHRDRGSDSRERRRSPPPKETIYIKKEARDYSRKSERENQSRDQESLRREERRHRFDDYPVSSNSSRDKSDRRKALESALQFRSKRPEEREPVRSSNKRSRSRSYESVASYNSNIRKTDRKHPESSGSRYRPSSDKTRTEQRESTRMKHSPIKPPGTSSAYAKPVPVRRDYHDELKFEPDYDEFSDVEQKAQETKAKRKASSPEDNRKTAKIPKTTKAEASATRSDKANVASSVSSSAVSESDSSDSEDPKESKTKNSESDHKQKHKKSKHKKHKKHKHKHKKKKSHKSKKD